MFEVIELTDFRKEDVDNDIYEVYCYPLVIAKAGTIDSLLASIFAYIVAYRLCYCFYLLRRITLTDNEVAADCTVNLG